MKPLALLASLFLLIPAASVALAADNAPRLFYSKSFPGSRPPYMEVRLERDGRAEYREGPDEDDPIAFRLPQSDVDAVFHLTEKLGRFNRELESGLKVARMGDKTYRWQLGEERHEVKFNYSTDIDAIALQDWFEKMCTTAILRIELERVARYDRLGVNSALLKIEATWDRKELVAADQFLKMLDKIAAGEVYMSMARERAQKLADIFRQGPPPAETKNQ